MQEKNNLFIRMFAKSSPAYFARSFILSRLSLCLAVLYGMAFHGLWPNQPELAGTGINLFIHLLPVLMIGWIALMYYAFTRFLSDSRMMLTNAMVWDVSDLYVPGAKELLSLPRRLSITGWAAGMFLLLVSTAVAYGIQESANKSAVLILFLISLSSLTVMAMIDYLVLSAIVTPPLDWIKQKKSLQTINTSLSADESLWMFGLFLFFIFVFFGSLMGISSAPVQIAFHVRAFWLLFCIATILGLWVFLRRKRIWIQFEEYMTSAARDHQAAVAAQQAVPELWILLNKVEQVTGRFYELFMNLENDSSEMNAAAKVVSETSSEQNSALIRQSASVTQTSSTLQELVQASKQIADSASAVVGYAENTEKKADHGLRVMQDSVTHVQKVREGNEINLSEVIILSEAIIEIDQVLNFIISIADETNLIALNAAIEASSAGEQGKRFKIVASEVRQLSTRVTKSIRTIKDITRKIQDATSKLVQTVQNHQEVIDESVQWVSQALVNLEDILEGAVQSADAAKQIYVAIQQQKIANQQIAISFNDISSDIQQIASASDRYDQYVRTLRKFSSNIEGALQSLNLDPIPGNDKEWNLR